MHLRKFSAIAAGALVAGTLSVPMALVSPAQAATAAGATFDCEVPMFEKTFEWVTDVNITGTRDAGASNATLVATIADLTGFSIPVDVASMENNGILAVTAGGASADLKGTRIATVPASSPVPSPTMTGSIAVLGDSVDVGVTKLNFVAKAMGLDVEVACIPRSAIKVAGVAIVTAAPIPSPAPPPAAAPAVASKVKVGAAVKKKVATVTAKVTGAKGAGTGKVSITIKKGKKVVKKGSVTLKKGKATLKTKKLAKGKYTVTVSYAGSPAYKAGNGKKTFKVK